MERQSNGRTDLRNSAQHMVAAQRHVAITAEQRGISVVTSMGTCVIVAPRIERIYCIFSDVFLPCCRVVECRKLHEYIRRHNATCHKYVTRRPLQTTETPIPHVHNIARNQDEITELKVIVYQATSRRRQGHGYNSMKKVQ